MLEKTLVFLKLDVHTKLEIKREEKLKKLVVKIQSKWRMYIVRKKIQIIKKECPVNWKNCSRISCQKKVSTQERSRNCLPISYANVQTKKKIQKNAIGN